MSIGAPIIVAGAEIGHLASRIAWKSWKTGLNLLYIDGNQVVRDASFGDIVGEIDNCLNSYHTFSKTESLLYKIYGEVNRIHKLRGKKNHTVVIFYSRKPTPSDSISIFIFSVSGDVDCWESDGKIRLYDGTSKEDCENREVEIDLNNYKNAEEAMFGLQIARVLEE